LVFIFGFIFEETTLAALEQFILWHFGDIAPKELTNFQSLFKKVTIKKGDYLLKQGTDCRHLSFVQSGLLRVYTNTEKKEVTQWISTEGYFTTDLASFIFETPSRWSIQALSDAEVFRISREDYKKLGTIVTAWNELEKRFLVKCFTLLEDRIQSHLSMTAEERYAFFFAQNKALFNQVPLHYIASMLGMTPETFSRIRKKHTALIS
jgi:CRP-like cAMP-binding protein